jgi:hypothetical protein
MTAILNVFQLITTIDGILDRLHPVKPLWSLRNEGVTQWLYRAKTQDSFEPELSLLTTELSAPVFPNPRNPEDLEEDTFPLQTNGQPLPEESKDLRHFSVDWRMIQILSGV